MKISMDALNEHYIKKLESELSALRQELEEAKKALSPKPPREGIYPWAVELEPTARHAQFWIEGGRNEPDKGKAVMCVEQGVNSWKNACYSYAEKNYELTAERDRLDKELEEEREAHAQLQSRCYDQGGTFSNVFDECAALKKELEEAKVLVRGYSNELAEAMCVQHDLTAERDRLTKELEEKDRRIAELEATLSQEQVKMLREAMQDLKDEGVLKHSIIDKALAATAPKGE